MAKYQTAERTGEKADGKCRKHCEGRRQGIEFREEQLVKNQRPDKPIDEEIVLLDGISDGACHERTATRARPMARLYDRMITVRAVLKSLRRHVFPLVDPLLGAV